jgi:ATP-binding cassette, subfamily B, bacterial
MRSPLAKEQIAKSETANQPHKSQQLPHPLVRLLNYGHAYNRQIALASSCSILNKLFDLAPPALIGTAVDTVVQRQNSLLGGWGIKDVWWQLVVISLASAVIWALESAFEYAYARLWRNLAQNIQHNLRLDAYSHLQQLELSFFEERNTGELMAILSDDINQLERFLDGGANEVLQVTTTVIIIGAAFFMLAPGVAWMAMLPMPFILWGSIAFQKRLAPRYADVREKVGALNTQLSNNLGGITTIKSFTTEDYEQKRIAAESERYRQSNRRAIALSAAFVPLIRIIVFVGFIATLLFGGLEVDAGRLSVGAYSVMVFLTQRLLWPLTRLGETLDQYQRAMASTNRVMNLLDTPIEIPSGHLSFPVPDLDPANLDPHDRVAGTINSQTNGQKNGYKHKYKVRGEIEFHHVNFAYRKGFPVVSDLSLHVPAGKTIAVVGATGSGKSTLVKLIMRLYEVTDGKITLDGIDIRDLQLQELRSCIGWVSQDVFLFHGSVLENIAYGSFDATVDQIVEAAKVAEAHEFIQQLPNGYDTIVGERGQKLSGGQRQRLAIARAVLRDPAVLILDEATSAVDNETEAAIQKSLEQITVNRTTIAIAHRLSTVRDANRIYVMDRGRIAEQGRHEDLLEQHGIYASLWRVQTGIKA